MPRQLMPVQTPDSETKTPTARRRASAWVDSAPIALVLHERTRTVALGRSSQSRTEMNEEELSPEQREHVEAMMADLGAQSTRVSVDLRAAMRDINEIEAPRIQEDEGGESWTESFTIDLSGILETLRVLPDGAGTSAFVAAYNQAHRDWRERPPEEH